MTYLVRWSCVLAVALLIGCAAQPSAAAQQRSQGQRLYDMHCARCHGAHGEGKRGPVLIGPTHGLRGYGTAQELYTYVSGVMPYDAPGTLSADEYWAVLSYLTDANGMLPPDTTLDGTNAEQIRVDQP